VWKLASVSQRNNNYQLTQAIPCQHIKQTDLTVWQVVALPKLVKLRHVVSSTRYKTTAFLLLVTKLYRTSNRMPDADLYNTWAERCAIEVASRSANRSELFTNKSQWCVANRERPWHPWSSLSPDFVEKSAVLRRGMKQISCQYELQNESYSHMMWRVFPTNRTYANSLRAALKISRTFSESVEKCISFLGQKLWTLCSRRDVG